MVTPPELVQINNQRACCNVRNKVKISHQSPMAFLQESQRTNEQC